MAFTSHDSIIAGSDSGTLVRFASGTVARSRELAHSTSSIISICSGGSQSIVVTGGADSKICVWAAESLDLLTCVDVSPDSHVAATGIASVDYLYGQHY